MKVTSQKKLFTFPKTSSSNENSSQPIATCDADKSETDKVSAECNEMSSVTKSNFEAATNVYVINCIIFSNFNYSCKILPKCFKLL